VVYGRESADGRGPEGTSLRSKEAIKLLHIHGEKLKMADEAGPAVGQAVQNIGFRTGLAPGSS